MHFKGDNENGLEENIGTNSSNCIDYSNNKTNNTLTNVIQSEILKQKYIMKIPKCCFSITLVCRTNVVFMQS